MVSGLLALNPEPQNLNPKPYSLAESLLRVLGLRAQGCLIVRMAGRGTT